MRAGNAPVKQGLLGILKRLLPLLRKAFPKARLRVLLDAGFAGPELLEVFEREGLEYAVCLAGNPTLKRAAGLGQKGKTARVRVCLQGKGHRSAGTGQPRFRIDHVNQCRPFPSSSVGRPVETEHQAQ